MLVFISVTAVIVYRVYLTVAYCGDNSVCDLLHGTVVATLLNTLSIMILGRVSKWNFYLLFLALCDFLMTDKWVAYNTFVVKAFKTHFGFESFLLFWLQFFTFSLKFYIKN